MARGRHIVERRGAAVPRERAGGETIPFDFEELERLRKQAATARPERASTAPIEHEHEVLEITIDGEDDPAPRKQARAATVSDPMTTSILAEIERIDRVTEPAPPVRDSNRHLKRRGS